MNNTNKTIEDFNKKFPFIKDLYELEEYKTIEQWLSQALAEAEKKGREEERKSFEDTLIWLETGEHDWNNSDSRKGYEIAFEEIRKNLKPLKDKQ